MPHSFNTASLPWKLSVSLLKEFTVVLHTADGLSYRVPISPNAKRVQLLAYLAWKRDEIRTKKILDEVFRSGSTKEKATQSTFYSHIKLVKRDIQAAIIQLNIERGADPLPTNLDLFEHNKHQGWRLSSLWQVTDLEKVEVYAQVVQEAENHLFLGPLPEQMREACDMLIAAYPGDFLEEMLRAYPEEFRPKVTSWVREPYTLYRDNYLQALWCAAEDEWQRGEVGPDGDGQSWVHFEQAAELFRRYAMYACNSRLDTKVSFQAEEHWARLRVSMSEDAMCHSLALYKERGRIQDFEECKLAYAQQMEQISHGIWKPGEKLREIMQSVNQ